MRTRILPVAEWGRLPASLSILDHVNPEDVDVIVVETEGEIVACAAVLKLIHLEGLWVDPSKRGNPGIGRALLRETLNTLEGRTTGWVLAASENEMVNEALVRLGAMPVPVSPEMRAFVLDMSEEGSWRHRGRLRQGVETWVG